MARPEELRVDARVQNWRNAEILEMKRRFVHFATIGTLPGMLTWLMFLLAAGFTGTRSTK